MKKLILISILMLVFTGCARLRVTEMDGEKVSICGRNGSAEDYLKIAQKSCGTPKPVAVRGYENRMVASYSRSEDMAGEYSVTPNYRSEACLVYRCQ